MVPQWIIDLLGESRSTALPVIAVYFGYRLICRVLAPLTVACFVVLVGGKERSERALRLVRLLQAQKDEETRAVTDHEV